MKNKLLFILLLLVTITGCSSNSYSSPGNYSINTEASEEYYYDYDSELYGIDELSTESATTDKTQRKITKTCSTNITTSDLEKSLVTLNQLINDNLGYITSSYDNLGDQSYSYKYSNLLVKIPSDKVELFVENLSEVGKITSKTLNTSDITDSYNKTESILNSLKIQEERLLELLNQADNVTDLITIESQLANVRSDIDYYSYTLSSYDNQVEYSEVSIKISESKDTKIEVEDDFFGEVSNAFFRAINNIIYFVQGIIILIVSIWPFIILIVIIGFIIKNFLKKKPKLIKDKKDNDITDIKNQ